MSERKGVCGVCTRVHVFSCILTCLLFIYETKLLLSIFCNFLLQFWDRASHWSWNSMILLVSKARDLLASILPALGFQCELLCLLLHWCQGWELWAFYLGQKSSIFLEHEPFPCRKPIYLINMHRYWVWRLIWLYSYHRLTSPWLFNIRRSKTLPLSLLSCSVWDTALANTPVSACRNPSVYLCT